MNLSTLYEQKALTYGMSKAREKSITELLPLYIKDLKILDVGCASGYFGSKLGKKGAKVFGIDISQRAIKIASKALNQAKVADLNTEKIPYPKNTFDIIVASEIIEHLVNPRFALKEFKRVLKKDGFLIVSTPNFMYWGNRIKFLKGEFRYEKFGMFDEGHIHFYTHKTLIEDLESSNFKLVEENHIYLGFGNLSPFKKHFPSLFAYQFVVKCIKK